ncbi:uncharacterized protein LOC101859580 [Aplysia californica]|uniref:Uncharacterized protein LOC101859580 n=1 Tax=Aplysia californica TaxID=6500 RepID=A0ABM0JVY4_APLCA|nr:uncharacterized protein LOC101859580 [Aplysia californica]XP_005102781.1 uncharacterized protein LOC101859580 [Aplysia californica]
MGCAPSVVSPDGELQFVEKTPVKSPNHGHQNGHVKTKSDEIVPKIDGRVPAKQNIDKNANKLGALPPQAPVPKSVAFEVTLDGEAGSGLTRVKKRPPRLQALEPLDIPRLTAEQLAEKQRLADEKRERLKLKKINTSQKSSRRRRELLKAKEFGMKQQMDQEKTVLDDSLKQAEIRKEQRLLEIKEKQRIREERAKRIRERAKRIQNPDEEVEVEKDMEFNATSDDSWLSNPGQGEEHHNEAEDEEEHGLQKRVSQLRPTASASTVDSYDAAFMRQNTDERMVRHVRPAQNTRETGDLNDDDFFGS